MDLKFMMIMLIVALVVVLIIAPQRRGSGFGRVCRNCGAEHPPFGALLPTLRDEAVVESEES